MHTLMSCLASDVTCVLLSAEWCWNNRGGTAAPSATRFTYQRLITKTSSDSSAGRGCNWQPSGIHRALTIFVWLVGMLIFQNSISWYEYFKSLRLVEYSKLNESHGSCGSLEVFEFFSRLSRHGKSLKTDMVLESAWIWFSKMPWPNEWFENQCSDIFDAFGKCKLNLLIYAYKCRFALI